LFAESSALRESVFLSPFEEGSWAIWFIAPIDDQRCDCVVIFRKQINKSRGLWLFIRIRVLISVFTEVRIRQAEGLNTEWSESVCFSLSPIELEYFPFWPDFRIDKDQDFSCHVLFNLLSGLNSWQIQSLPGHTASTITLHQTNKRDYLKSAGHISRHLEECGAKSSIVNLDCHSISSVVNPLLSVNAELGGSGSFSWPSSDEFAMAHDIVH
jgi:hypothetical protein